MNYAFTIFTSRKDNKESLFDPEKQRAMLALEKEASAIKNENQNRTLRFWLAVGVFVYVCVYTGYVVSMINKSAQMFNFYSLDKEVAITLLTTTCINIIGLLTIVVRNLFPTVDLSNND